MVKTCTKCNEEKPLECFSKNKRAKDGKLSACKACDRAKSTAWAKANPEKAIAKLRAWREANPERYAALQARIRANSYNAVPSWYTKEHQDQIASIYAERNRITEATGIPHEVDHILPMNGDTVSGFHLPDNLQIITRTENIRKGNKHDFS